jgi:hypothetical protein
LNRKIPEKPTQLEDLGVSVALSQKTLLLGAPSHLDYGYQKAGFARIYLLAPEIGAPCSPVSVPCAFSCKDWMCSNEVDKGEEQGSSLFCADGAGGSSGGTAGEGGSSTANAGEGGNATGGSSGVTAGAGGSGNSGGTAGEGGSSTANAGEGGNVTGGSSGVTAGAGGFGEFAGANLSAGAAGTCDELAGSMGLPGGNHATDELPHSPTTGQPLEPTGGCSLRPSPPGSLMVSRLFWALLGLWVFRRRLAR